MYKLKRQPFVTSIFLLQALVSPNQTFGTEKPCPTSLASYEPSLRLALKSTLTSNVETGKTDTAQASFSPDGKLVLIFPEEDSPWVWNLANSTAPISLGISSSEDQWGWIPSTSPDSPPTLLLHHSESEHPLKHINPFTGETLQAIDLKLRPSLKVSEYRGDPEGAQLFSPKGKYLLIGVTEGENYTPLVVDTHTGEVVRELRSYQSARDFNCLTNAFSLDETLVVTCSRNGNVRVENIQTGQLVFGYVLSGENEKDLAIDSFIFSRTNKYLLAKTKSGKVWSFDLDQGTTKTIKGIASNFVSLSKNNALIINNMEKVVVLDSPTSANVKALFVSSETVFQNDFWTDDGNIMIQLGGDRFITIDPIHFRPLYELKDSQADPLAMGNTYIFASGNVGLIAFLKHLSLWTDKERLVPTADISGKETLFTTQDEAWTISLDQSNDTTVVRFHEN